MIDLLKKLSPIHIWLFSIAISIITIGGIVGSTGMLVKGEATYDYLLMGFVASLLVAGLVGGFLILFLARQSRMGTDIHLVDTAPEPQKTAAVIDTVSAEDSGKNTQYVAMSHEADGYVATVRQISTEKGHSDIRQAIRNLDVLPAMPVIAQKLLELKLDTEEGERMLLVLIEQDPQISAKILGLANSAMVGASRHIPTVRHAAILLGTKRIQSVATGIAIISLMTKAPSGKFDIQELWSHSFRIAFAVQGIAQFMPAKIRPPDDQIFLACMLHDIGYLVLAYLDPKLSDRLHARLEAEPERPVMEIEREILDMCHDELGAELARHWNLPEEIIAVLRYHHNPGMPGAEAGQPLVHMIGLAQKLLPSLSIIEYTAHDISTEVWEALGISPSKVEEVKEQVAERSERAAELVSSFS